MGLRDLQHFEFGWDLHTDKCPECIRYYAEPLTPEARALLCTAGKKFYDQWFELFNGDEQ